LGHRFGLNGLLAAESTPKFRALIDPFPSQKFLQALVVLVPSLFATEKKIAQLPHLLKIDVYLALELHDVYTNNVLLAVRLHPFGSHRRGDEVEVRSASLLLGHLVFERLAKSKKSSHRTLHKGLGALESVIVFFELIPVPWAGVLGGRFFILRDFSERVHIPPQDFFCGGKQIFFFFFFFFQTPHKIFFLLWGGKKKNETDFFLL
jgi:hypothetical protein